MHDDKIYLHKQYGLNPTMTTCYFCNEANEILLVGNKTKQFREAGIADPDGKMPMQIGVVDMRPCPKCEEWMKKGIIIISIANDTTDKEMQGPMPNPRRTGGWSVITDDGFKRIGMEQKFEEWGLKHRFMFMTDEAYDRLGIPRGDTETKSREEKKDGDV